MNKTSHCSLRRLVQGLLLALLAFWVTPVQAQYVYWTNADDGGIHYAPANTVLAGDSYHLATARSGSPWGIATDGTTWVYYSTGLDRKIYRCKLDGSGNDLTWAIDVSKLDPNAEPLGLGYYNGFIYWADYGTQQIGKASTTTTNLVDAQASAAYIISGCLNPFGVKANANNIFWVNAGINPGTSSLGVAKADGTVISQVFVTYSAGNLHDLDLNGTDIYLLDDPDGATHPQKIIHIPTSSSGAGIISTGVDPNFSIPATAATTSVAVGGTQVYWSGSGMGQDSISDGSFDGGSGTGANAVPFVRTSGQINGITYGTAIPTVVTLTSFTATPKATQVAVAWKTGSEVDTAGFNIWRSATATGTFAKVNAAIIPAQGTGMGGASYSWTDTNVSAGQTWYYKLEDIDTHGVSTLHGPVSATVGAVSPILSFQATPSDIFLGGGSLLNWTVTGSPALSLSGLGPVSSSSLWVTPQSSTSYTLSDGQGDQNLTTVNVKPFGFLDMPGLSKAWGSSKGDPNYNPSYDLNGDGKVDDTDVAILFKGL